MPLFYLFLKRFLSLHGASTYSVSTSTDTKYFPLGTCDMPADFILPMNSQCAFALTPFNFGSFILPPSKSTAIFPSVKFVV